MSSTKPLYETYPVNSVLELTLKGVDEKVKGVVYCTDEISQTVVLKKALTHTTLASEIFVVQANAVTNSKVVEAEANEEENLPVGNVSKKALEQQEKKAIKLAEEALLHINQKVKVFDALHPSTNYRACVLTVEMLCH
jgi:protein LSM12